ncbi:MAG: competence/damage-inducible protein A [Campylobacterales bacterium]
MRFYAVVIGTELLNGRRHDSHVPFLTQTLNARDWELAGVFTIADKPGLIEAVYELVSRDEEAVMFSFGGIGATPDDYTRQCAANVFTGGRLEVHSEGLALLESRFGEVSPMRREMVNFPIGAQLLQNPVNNIPGFFLFKRFFFVPGFPEMAHPMVCEALDRFYPLGERKFRLTLTAQTGEGDLVALMRRLPESIELSSLPETHGGRRRTVISLSGYDQKTVQQGFEFFQAGLKAQGVAYEISGV